MELKHLFRSRKRLIMAAGIFILSITGIIFIFRNGLEKPLKEPNMTVSKPITEADLKKEGGLPHPPMSITEYNSRSTFGPLPSHMTDVAIDGALQTTKDGHLVYSKKIRQLFDFFLMAVNDEGMQGCSGRIEEIITMSLTGDAKNEALAIWAAYKKYRLALSDTKGESEFVTRKEGAAHFENILESRIKLRRQTMPAYIADIFFGE
jgi:hypothetical protein